MNVGDYVRTKYGYIGKIVKPSYSYNFEVTKKEIKNPKKVETFIMDTYYACDDEPDMIEKEDIIKSSPNIIDLIEEHDILKIEEQKGVYTICEVETFREPYGNYDFLGVRLNNSPIARKLYELNIKQVLTHEDFEANVYKIGE